MFAMKSYQDRMITEQTAAALGDDIAVDIDSLDDAGLDRFLIAQAIETPDNWRLWSLAAKTAWLKARFEPQTLQGSEMSLPGGANEGNGSKVALMKSLAALARPTEGESFDSATPGVGEAGQSDPLLYLVHEMDNLSEKDAVASLGRLANQSEVTLFRLGGVLARLKANGWHKTYDSFRAFVEAEHDIPYRKAAQWMAVYRRLAESKVAWERLQQVGWTKLKEISSVIKPDNVDQWVDIALDNNTRELVEIVADHKRTARPAGADAITRMTFRVHAGQKGAIQAAIDKAKTQNGAQTATIALENICATYLSGATFDQEARAMGLEACVRMMEKAYPNARIKVALAEDESQAA